MIKKGTFSKRGTPTWSLSIKNKNVIKYINGASNIAHPVKHIFSNYSFDYGQSQLKERPVMAQGVMSDIGLQINVETYCMLQCSDPVPD